MVSENVHRAFEFSLPAKMEGTQRFSAASSSRMEQRKPPCTYCETMQLPAKRRVAVSTYETRRYLEVKRVGNEEAANELLRQGWTLFAVVGGGGEHIHYVLTRRAVQ